MEKGLLTKTDPRSIKTNLLSRGIGALKNLIPRTGLERKLLGGLKKSFVPTEGGQFSIKGMASNFAKKKLTTMALQKLGLGALAPWLGVASMFGFDPMEWAMNKFSRKPKDMTAFNKLGLQADRVPTDPSERIASQGLTTSQKIAMGDVDLNKLITGDEFSDIKGQQAKNIGPALIQQRNFERKAKAPEIYGTLTPEEERMYKKSLERGEEEKIYRMPVLTAANGGLINLYRHGGFSG